MEISNNIRATQDNTKDFTTAIFQRFADSYGKTYQKYHGSKKIIRIGFGKTDMRGNFRITLYNDRGCISQSIGFDRSPELIGFVEGYLQALRYQQ